MARALELHSCDNGVAIARCCARDLPPASCADQDVAAGAITAAAAASAAAPSSSQHRSNSEKLATATSEEAVPPTGLGSDAVSDCSRRHAARTPTHAGSSRLQELSLDGEPFSSDDAPTEPMPGVPEQDPHAILLRVEVRYFTGTSPDILGTVEGVDRGEESGELLYRVRFSDGELIRYTSEQLNGLMADGFARILEEEDTENLSGIKKIWQQWWRG